MTRVPAAVAKNIKNVAVSRHSLQAFSPSRRLSAHASLWMYRNQGGTECLPSIYTP